SYQSRQQSTHRALDDRDHDLILGMRGFQRSAAHGGVGFQLAPCLTPAAKLLLVTNPHMSITFSPDARNHPPNRMTFLMAVRFEISFSPLTLAFRRRVAAATHPSYFSP